MSSDASTRHRQWKKKEVQLGLQWGLELYRILDDWINTLE